MGKGQYRKFQAYKPVPLVVSNGGGETVFTGSMSFFCSYSKLSNRNNLSRVDSISFCERHSIQLYYIHWFRV